MSPRVDLSDAFNAAPAALLVIDSAANVVAANAAALRLLGREEAVGEHVCAVLNGCRRGPSCDLPSCPVRGDELVEGARGVIAVSGAPGRVVVAESAGVDDAGHVVVHLLDTTETEARRRRELLPFVAHELRTPITVAMSHAELLAEGGDAFDAEVRAEMARDIVAAAERLNLMVGDLVAVATADLGVDQDEDEEVDLAEALARGLENAGAPLLDAPALRDLPPVRGGARAVARVAAEFVLNARIASSGAEPEVRARREGDEVVVEVADIGMALPEPELAVAFDRLARPSTRRRSRRTTGLGMTVARVLVESMSGSVGAANNPDGQGCTFWFRLPAAL